MRRLSSSLLLTLLFTAHAAHAQSSATDEDFTTWPGAGASDAGTPPPPEVRKPLIPSGAVEQESPSPSPEGWVPFPGERAATSEPTLPPPPLPPTPAPPPPPSAVARNVPPAPVLEPNTISLFGARPLGPGRRALGFSLGFPLVSARAAIGVTERLDLGLGFDTFYGVMNEPRLHGRFLLAKGSRVHFAAKLEAGWATFLQPANNEETGPRWLTGRRNYNLVPGVVLSFEGETPRSSRFFFDVGYHVAFDTQPFQKDPLAGIPGDVQISGNVPLRGGVEVPFSELTSFLIQLGFDLHGREEDSAFMPSISVGLVTSL